MRDSTGQVVTSAKGNSKFRDELTLRDFVGQKLLDIKTWGKHLILEFEDFTVRIHFLMFGSYSVNRPKPKRDPRLALRFSNGTAIYCYACSIVKLHDPVKKIYDWKTDLMSSRWNRPTVIAKIKNLKPNTMSCDLLMNQEIFTGLGNIMKNEVLYRTKIHPEKKIGKLSALKIKELVNQAHVYAQQFYEWRKKFELKKHWEIMRKKNCPKGHKVTRRVTGVGHRLSHFCETCQPLMSNERGAKLR